ncbi:MAG: bifunctional (p)ppGpp synthetase/guanosine-3',5'-bis(diphosphate) 3'-pyrophosphohydrolase [Paludibacteraceae bacterium]|nr:bifunctional (p)ppGpp synthetase/guanosine-3',5'-bis(diphosphate) 3'-pyrophosphohydrolase [Paludibacteraceae bacterium]
MEKEEKRKEIAEKFQQVLETAEDKFTPDEVEKLRAVFKITDKAETSDAVLDSMLRAASTALILEQEVNLGKQVVIAKIIFEAVRAGIMPLEVATKQTDELTGKLLDGLIKTEELSDQHNTSFESDNFRQLLLALAHDVRVIVILICDRLYLLQNIASYRPEEQDQIAKEASYLYAPLAHRMGLYHVKSLLEDLSMKFLHYDIYKEIAGKLNQTKRARDAYIAEFIEPVKKKLEEAGFKFSMKGRTKSIFSIWNKIKKQNTTFEHIYDLFAIRIIIDAPYEQEKSQCWQAYSIVTDMYQPNPKRLRDWLSIPKSNGYESLHTTVMGPQGRWVEVQIRTQRMDEIAEKGLAAHFKYKGVKSESDFDQFLASVRELLEHQEGNDVNSAMDEFKLSLYDKEVFVFTPTGELRKFPKGATILDFAFQIHSRLGAQCIGGRINGKNVPIRHILNNGDQVEIVTSSAQKPTKEWLNIVQTSKAKSKIRQLLREQDSANAEIGKETFQRRFRNWKIEIDDVILSKYIKRVGYNNIMEFYTDVANEKCDLTKIREEYLEFYRKEKHIDETTTTQSASNFEHKPIESELVTGDDVLVIDQNLKGIQYELARCCNPIYGDPVFGFVSSHGTIKVHKNTCPNAPQLINRFGYRVVRARWSGKSVGGQFVGTIRVVGKDDIGIMTNISSLIQREPDVSLRAISVNSEDGLFQGNISVRLNDAESLETLIRKLRTVKGVTSVSRA